MSDRRKDVIPYNATRAPRKPSDHRRDVCRERHPDRKLVGRWGDTTRDEDACRRVFVTHYPHDTTLQELEEFFGHENLDAIAMWSDYAFVQFRRPKYYTDALSKNRMEFRRRSILIEPYRDFRKQPAKTPKNRSASQEHGAAFVDTKSDLSRIMSRSPGRVRSSSRGRSRSRDSSRERSRSRDSSESGRRRGLVLRDPNSRETDSGIFNFNQQFGCQPNNHLQAPVPTQHSYYPPNQHAFAQTSFRQPEMWNRNLPTDIQLTMQLVLQQGTARGLSLTQIQSIINYMESERQVILTRGAHNGQNVITNPNPDPVVTPVDPCLSIVSQVPVESPPKPSTDNAGPRQQQKENLRHQQPPSADRDQDAQTSDEDPDELAKEESEFLKLVADMHG